MQNLRLFLTGLAMGAADIVPGVSGGTMAFIFGVYERLVNSIKLASGEAVKLLLRGQFKAAIKVVPFSFLVPLVLGILTAIVLMSNLLEYLLQSYPVFVWSFFFGLVVASILVVSKRVSAWNSETIGGLVVATLLAYIVVGIVPVQTPATLLAFFLAGAIAICAMILPGISGAFLLLIMGKYEQVLSAITDRNILVLVVLMAGAALGLGLFSRLLSWLFEKKENLTIAVLTGFMLGSLRKIWPWKETLTSRFDNHGQLVPLTQKNILPPSLNLELLVAILLAVVAVIFVVYLDKKNLVTDEA